MIRENILANLVTTCQGITVGNGYHVTIASVERFEVDGNPLVDTPAVIVSALDQEKVVETNRSMEWDLKVRLDVFTVHNKATDSRSTDQVLTELAGDIYKSVMVDRTRGGHALTTTVESISDFDLIHEDGRDTGVIAVLGIRFRHAVGNPETAI